MASRLYPKEHPDGSRDGSNNLEETLLRLTCWREQHKDDLREFKGYCGLSRC
jgi:hypothetical protein